MRIFTTLTMAILAWSCGFAQESEKSNLAGFGNEAGYRWTYREVETKGDGTEPILHEVDYGFDGTLEFAGREYAVFKHSGEHGLGMGNPVSYIRQEDGKVYAYVSENSGVTAATGSEHLLYDFNMTVGETFTSYSRGRAEECRLLGKWTVNLGGERRVLRFAPMKEDFYYLIVEGIGPIYYGTMGTLGLYDWYTGGVSGVSGLRKLNSAPFHDIYADLKEVRDAEGNIIYDSSMDIMAPVRESLGFFITEDYTWEYSYDLMDGKVRFKMKFDGEEEVDGKVYHRFRPVSQAVYRYKDSALVKESEVTFPNSTPFLLRQDMGKVYLNYKFGKSDIHPYPFFPDGEYLLYDFLLQEGETMPLLMANYDEDTREYRLVGTNSITISGKASLTQHLESVEKYMPPFYLNSLFGNLSEGTLVTFDYDARTGGINMTPQTACPPHSVGSQLIAVYDKKGRVVYGEDPSKPSTYEEGDTWNYLKVNVRDMFLDSKESISTQNGTLSYAGTTKRNGTEYHRFAWQPPYGEKSYFLMRETQGAYYTYIEYPEDPESDPTGRLAPKVSEGEYLLYDFNMIPGTTFTAPYLTFFMDGAVIAYEVSRVKFTVKDNDRDEYGRGVLTLEATPWDVEPGGSIDSPITVVEGVGPLTQGILPAYMFTPKNTGHFMDPLLEFDYMTGSDGETEYVAPCQREAGFFGERDYTWVYAIVDESGDVSYKKMGFDYVVRPKNDSPYYRRFGTLGTSDCFDGEWEKADFDRHLVREQDGKVWLCHEKDEMNIGYQSDKTPYMSLIYDFNATDGQTLDFYTTDGFRSLTVKTGMTEVNGEETPDYLFEGTDGIKCVKGLGIVRGGILPCVNTEFRRAEGADDRSMANAQLVSVFDGEGNLIFRQDVPGIIRTVGEEAGDFFLRPADRLYDLQGRELREPVPGQPYIKGGKVLVAPK